MGKQTTSGRIGRVMEALASPGAPGQPVQPVQPVQIVGARGGFLGVVLAAVRQASDRMLVVVTPDEARARVVADAIDLFLGGAGELDPVVVFRELEYVPFQGISPSRANVMGRVATLFRVVHDVGVRALVVPAPALLDRLIPRAALDAHARLLSKGDQVDRDELLGFLASSGYHPVASVEDPGTFAARGGIVDIFSPLYRHPVRLDFWGDEIDTLRFFDPSTQSSIRDSPELFLGPARNIVFTPATIRRATSALYDLADEVHVPTTRTRQVVEDVKGSVLGVGMEDLLPAFYDSLGTLFDLLPPDATWIVDEPDRCVEAMVARSQNVTTRAEAARASQQLAYSADRLFVPGAEATESLRRVTAGELRTFTTTGTAGAAIRFDTEDNSDVRREIEAATREGAEHVLAPLTRRVREWRAAGHAVVVCAHGQGGATRLSGLLGHYGLKVAVLEGRFSLDRLPELKASSADVSLFVADPGEGFRAPDLGLVVVDEAEILGRRAKHRRRRQSVAPEAALAGWRDLEEGHHVVHLTHGIARYRGLTKTAIDGVETDFLVLEYAGGNKLFAPVHRLHLISKHVAGEGSHPTLDKLGGSGWVRTKTRVTKAVRKIADKLLKLYAERELKQGHAFSPPGEWFARFEAEFPFEETPDQAKAIEDVLDDMQKERPMDRIICGDVGFGKTEVAMRGAFMAVLEGKQVAVIVPTVVLAEQHRLTFERRMSSYPVTIDCLTRAKTSREATDIRKRLASGQVDIIIGTHRVLSTDVEFKDLGLVVVDEEHRFGVAQKERLKRYKASVDVLTLTATPIPRTLNLAMVGLRDISLIQTPPTERLSVRTLVAQPREEAIAEAIERELARGGQVFYVHNRVEDIYRHSELLSRLVPEARIAVGHGQMDRGKLEDVMMRFVRGEVNVLVCTTIVESGLDIPNANTMLINRADAFGLAQLYQLRGRVGRSSVRAYCYLLIPAPKNLQGDAARRIATIQRFSDLGSGFSVASFDLDIRGSGDILGADQSGQIDAVGYDAYMQLLRDAIRELRAQEEASEDVYVPSVEPELKVRIEGRIPEVYLPDTTLRLRLYRDLAGAEDVPALYDVYRLAVDRYGRPPEPVTNLVALMAVKLEAKALGLSSVIFVPGRLALGVPEGGIAPEVLARLVSRPRSRFRLRSDGRDATEVRLERELTTAEWEAGLETLRESLREVAEFVSEQRHVGRT